MYPVHASNTPRRLELLLKLADKLSSVLEKKYFYTLVSIDINMPVMDGWECLIGLKNNSGYKDIPVFIYSTSTLKSHVKKALDLGAAGFISKPSDFEEIKRILQHVYFNGN